ncbi:hypothetical protein [Phocaeicola coprophilus]|uniref:hypothetical protein n=1 Tax=Phocaeicola coprophilus TaxID=387090 RepID=UPI0040270893
MRLKTFVNRRQRNTYNAIRLAALSASESEADRIACAILACNYSRTHGDSKTGQALIQMDCVAVCFVDGDIWVASNSRKLEPEDIDEAIGADYCGWNVYIVTNGNGCMHAEMQLVEELREASLLDKVTYIGVSKPCCKYCKQVLNRYHIDYLHYHTDAVQHWEDPEVG